MQLVISLTLLFACSSILLIFLYELVFIWVFNMLKSFNIVDKKFVFFKIRNKWSVGPDKQSLTWWLQIKTLGLTQLQEYLETLLQIPQFIFIIFFVLKCRIFIYHFTPLIIVSLYNRTKLVFINLLISNFKS